MARKPYEEEEAKASEFIYDMFKKQFKVLQVERNPKKRNADFFIKFKGKLIALAELERKKVWTNYDFPSKWDSVSFPKRKGKYAESELPVFMVMFNKDGTNGLIVDAKTMAKSQVVKKRAVTRKYVTFGEEFYHVPLNNVVFGMDKFEDYIMTRLGLK